MTGGRVWGRNGSTDEHYIKTSSSTAHTFCFAGAMRSSHRLSMEMPRRAAPFFWIAHLERSRRASLDAFSFSFDGF